MRDRVSRWMVTACIWCASVGTGLAQTPAAPPAGPPGPHRGSWEVGGGVAYVAGYDFGERAAELTRNTGTTTGPFEQFTTESRVTTVPALQGRVGYYLTNDLAVEGGFRYAQPVFRVRLSADAEDAPDETADETLSQYVVDVSVVWHFSRAGFGGGRGVPFITAGAGYLRELHEGDELVETGTTFQVGGGIKYWFGAGRRVGLRGDAVLSFRDGGFDFEEGLRIGPTAGASILFVF